MALQDHSTPAPYVYSKKNGWLLTFVFLFLNLLTLKFTRKSGNGEKTGSGGGRGGAGGAPLTSENTLL